MRCYKRLLFSVHSLLSRVIIWLRTKYCTLSTHYLHALYFFFICMNHPPQHHNTMTLDPSDTHFSYLNTILGCWTLTSSPECSTNTVTSTQKNSAVFIYRMLQFLLRRVNYIRFFLLLIIHFSLQFYVQLSACQCLIKNYLYLYLHVYITCFSVCTCVVL